MDKTSQTLRVAIIGAGYAGVAALAELHKQAKRPLEVTLFEKTNHFAAGYAYQTPFDYHLLNGRAKAMSAFCDEPNHFVDWLLEHKQNDPLLENQLPIPEQFVPRVFYQEYMQSILQDLLEKPSSLNIHLMHKEIAAVTSEHEVVIDGEKQYFDKVILALGNPLPPALPFPINSDINVINNPWDYEAVAAISGDDPVLIIGTGLSMVDAVLSLTHHAHTGKITALSRHGLLPLPHTANSVSKNVDVQQLPQGLLPLIRHLREVIKVDEKRGQDWRGVINGLRHTLPDIWPTISTADKKRFLRHYLPYWNIHRHRVHEELSAMLADLQKEGRLDVIKGRVLAVEGESVAYRQRGQDHNAMLQVKHIINCTGPSLHRAFSEKSLLNYLLAEGLVRLDDLQLGLEVMTTGQVLTAKGEPSDWLYVLGSLTQGVSWETVAVPEISQQAKALVEQMLEAASQAQPAVA